MLNRHIWITCCLVAVLSSESVGDELDDAIAVVQSTQKITESLFEKPDKAKILPLLKHYTDAPLLVQEDGVTTGLKAMEKQLESSVAGIKDLIANGAQVDTKFTDHSAKRLITGSIVVTSEYTVFVTANGKTTKNRYTSLYVLVPIDGQWKIAVDSSTVKK